MRRTTPVHARSAALALLFGLAGIPACAARQPVIKFLKREDLSALGLRIRVPYESRQVPLPPPTVYTYTFRRGTETRRESLYDPDELWRRSQQCGEWVDRYDNTMILATITAPRPTGFRRKHASREEFDNRQEAVAKAHRVWDADSIAAWAAAFTGAGGASAERAPRHALRLKELLRIRITGQAPGEFAYAFRLNRAAAGQGRGVPTWFFVLFRLNPQADFEKSREAIEKKFLDSVSAIVPPRHPEQGPSARFQTPLLKRPDKSPEFLESCRQVVASIRGLPDWWYVETENYIVLSNMGARHRVFVRDLQEELEILRRAYEELLPARTPVSAVSTVRVFATPAEYSRHVGKEYEWTDGIWMPSKRELVIRPATWGSNRQQRKRTLSITYHEAFHQYAHYALGRIPISRWFDEGHAELFEAAEIRNDRVELREDDRQARRVQALIRAKKADLARLLRLSPGDFYSFDNEARKANYALAWALVYFLRKDGGGHGAPYAGILDHYVDALCRSRDAAKATTRAFEDVDMNALHRDFEDFWTSGNRRSAARRRHLFRTRPR